MNITRGVGFEPVHAVGSLLSGLTVPWWITGGWAIDQAAGHLTRDHTDVDVMMLERDEHALRGLTGVNIQLIAAGQPPGPCRCSALDSAHGSKTGDRGPDVGQAPTCGVGGQVELPTFRWAGRCWLATRNKVLP